jgi:hypothetical protein
MRGLTTVVIRHRWLILLCWLVLFVLGGLGAAKLGPLLSNRFSVPGSDAEKGLNIVRAKFHERSDGAFTLVVQSHGAPVDRATVQAAAERGASVLDQGRAGPVLSAGQGVLYAQINSALENAKASDRTPAVRAAVGHIPGATVYVTGFPALNHDEQPLYSSDLTRGESIAIPIALIVLLYMFATVGATLVPIVFALITIPTTLGGVWIVAHFMSMATYVTNIVSLIGIAIAIDYSMLVVFRFREELAHGKEPDDALITTMMTAGRATLFSGSTVAVGLALLAFMPLPFIRSMGIGGLLVPLVSMAPRPRCCQPCSRCSATGSTRCASSRAGCSNAAPRPIAACGRAWRTSSCADRWLCSSCPRSCCWPSPRPPCNSGSPAAITGAPRPGRTPRMACSCSSARSAPAHSRPTRSSSTPADREARSRRPSPGPSSGWARSCAPTTTSTPPACSCPRRSRRSRHAPPASWTPPIRWPR